MQLSSALASTPAPPPRRFLVPHAALTMLSPTQVSNPAELRNIIAALGPRDDAIRRGMTLQGQRYEVQDHASHPRITCLINCHGTPPDTLTLVMNAICIAIRVTSLAVLEQVHRHHPPLVYGRLHGTDPEHSTGAAVCETKQSITGGPLYTFITYECVLEPPAILLG